jgi:hypothetical protein
MKLFSRAGQFAGLIVPECFLDFSRRIHHEWALRYDGLVQRPPGDQEDPAGGRGAERNTIMFRRLTQDRQLPFRDSRAGDLNFAPVDIQGGVMPRGQCFRKSASRRQMNIQHPRCRDRPFHSALNAMAFAHQHPDVDAIPGCERRDGRALHVTIIGRRQLVAGGQVQPELKALHRAILLLRHFGMDHPAPRQHPLHAAA